MKIYEVIPDFGSSRHVVIVQGGPRHVVVAKSESEAIKTVVDYLNQFQTFHLFELDDFCANAIDADKFSEPMIID